MNKDYPVGTAQWKVLTALGLTAQGFNEANAIFEKLGLQVSSKRVGRSSEPVVTLLDTVAGGFNAGGDGETATGAYRAIDLTPLFQWMSVGDQREAQRWMDAAAKRVAKQQDAQVISAETLSNEVQTERDALSNARRTAAAQQKAARRLHAQQRSRLYAAGYRWRQLGVNDDGDNGDDDWTLCAPSGEPISLAVALAAMDVVR